MGTPLDPAGIQSSLTQRRQATQNLPVFELPPPNFAPSPYQHKFPPLSGIHAQPHPSASVGNLLTPPPNSGSDSGPSTGPMQSQSMPVLPYTPTFWQGAATANGYNGLHPQPWQQHNMYPQRSMFSPLSGTMPRPDPHSPPSTSGTSLPPPPYEIGMPPYGQSVHLASPGSSIGQPSQHPGISNQMMSNHRPGQQSPISPADPSKASTQGGMIPGMTAVSTPQQQYGFQGTTPISQSPHPSNVSAPTTSPPMQQGQMPQMSQAPFIKPPYPSYSLPAMPGPVMTNVSNPGGQMSIVGNVHGQMLPIHYNSGYAANPQLHYAQARTNSPASHNQDRPFKCDECPQSFNRNHDLKRHKRIHLAVKPFPCGHCDKSFSRKDALKRHILVKGCGKAGMDPDSSLSEPKSESESDTMVSVAA